LDHFVRDSALLGLDACAGHNNAGIDARTIVAQAQIATLRSVRPDTLDFRRHLEKVAAALSVVSGAASKLLGVACGEGDLRTHTHDIRARDKLCGMLGVAGRNTIQAGE